MRHITTDKGVENALTYLRRKSILGLDTETTGLDPLDNKILLLQIGDQGEQFVFDIYKLGAEVYPVLDWLVTDDITIVMHNAKFDYSMIKTNFDRTLQKVICTMIGEQLLNQGRKQSASFEAVCLKYIGVPLDKTQQSTFIDMKWGQTFTTRQLQYAADDIKYLIPVYKKIQSLLDSRGMKELSALEYNTTRVTADMEINGIFLDRKKWLALKDKAIAGADTAQAKLDKFFDSYCQKDLFGNLDINYNSPTQLLPILSDITKTKLKSTAEPALKRLNHPVIKVLLEYRGHQKNITTYGQEFLNQYVSKIDGRIHSSFKQLGADSGRYASREPNMTNIPKAQEYRAAFIAQDPEYRIISADFSGQELRLLAHLTQEPKFLYALQNNMDLHSYSASLIFGIPYEKFFDENGKGIKEMKDKYRNPAKSLTFGLIYGIGPMKLSLNLGITIKKARNLMNTYFSTFPAIKKTLEDLTEDAEKNRYALSPLDGRRRDLTTFDWDDSRQVAHAFNITKNLPFQGCGASTTKLAMCKLKNLIDKEKYDAKIINAIHDEILVEVHKDEAEDVAKYVQKAMIEAFNHYAPSVPMEVEPAIGREWIH